MRKALALALIATVLAVMAYITKPSDELCVLKAKEAFKETKLPTITTPATSQKINTQLLAETMEKNFEESLLIEDRFLYKNIYLVKGTKTRIGWGGFGWVNVEIK